MSFTDAEIAYLRTQPLGRLATVAADGQPDVVPVAIDLEEPVLWVCGAGAQVANTRKYRNVRAGYRRVALVFDDMPSLDPFIARGIRIYGVADDPVERVGMVGPGLYMRVVPTISWSWNLDAEPAGETWYETRRAVHAPLD